MHQLPVLLLSLVLFAACSCNDESRYELSDQEFQRQVLEPILEKKNNLIEECRYRDEENMFEALEELEGTLQNKSHIHNLSEKQKQYLSDYQQTLLPKLNDVVKILSQPSLHSHEFELAMDLLNESEFSNLDILSQSSGR